MKTTLLYLKNTRNLFALLVVLLWSGGVMGQTTIAFNGAETSPTWNTSSNNFISSSLNTGTPASRIKSGLKSWQLNNGSATFITDGVSTSGYTNCFVEIWNSSISTTTGNGIEASDTFEVFLSETNTFSTTADVTIDASGSNIRWGMDGTGLLTTTAGIPITQTYTGLNVTKTGASAFSKILINVPSGWLNVYVKIVAVNNAAGEIWCLDDVSLKGTLASGDPVLAITGTTDNGTSCPTVPAATQTYTITNTGTTAAAGVTVVSSDAQFVVSGLSSTTIAGSGGTVTYTVTFTPSSAGAKSATITAASTTSGSNTPTSTLSGTGTAIALGAVTTSAVGTITAKSAVLNGNVTSLGSCPVISQRGFVYSVTATNSTPTNAGGGVVTFTDAGTSSGTYSFTANTLLAATQYSYRAYVLNGATYTYGSVVNFTTSPALVVSGTLAHGSSCPTFAAPSQTNTITNNSASTVTGITVGSNNPEFVVSSLSATSIAAGATATYTVTFTPATSGVKAATVTISSSQPNVTSTLSGTGITPVTPSVTTVAATLVKNTTATLGASASTFGVCPNTTVKGFVYSVTGTNSNPLIGGAGVTNITAGSPGTAGAFTQAVAGLTHSTQYSFKPYLFDGTTYTYGVVNTFTTTTPPANDDCSNAITLTVNAAVTAGQMTSSNTTPAIDTYLDVWYKFTPTCTGKSTIRVSDFVGDLDVSYFVSCASTTPVQSANTTSNPEILTTSASLNSGTTYFIRVRSYNAAGDTSTFNVSVNNQVNIVTQPSDAIVGASATATFSTSMPANATGYQWQVNSGSGWANVSGGTGGTTNSYTTGSTTLAMNGYQYRVVVSNGTCNPVTSSVALLTVDYCPSSPTSNDGSGITNVIVGSANFPVADVNYYSYTNSIPELPQGQLVNSSVSFATGFGYDAHIWIDYNDDGIFNSTNEKVFSGLSASTNPTTLTTNFTVAVGANLGLHKMRIGTADSGQSTANPCYSGTYGVTVDMMINVIVACTPPTDPTGIISGTTPNCDSTVLTYTGSDASTAYWQTTAGGTSILSPATSTKTVVNSGTYHVRIYNGDCWSSGTKNMAVVINKTPTITTAPVSVSVVTGATATFSVVATNANSYQWQTDASGSWVNVSGVGTNASYSISGTTLAMSDTNYRVIVTSTLCGSVNSNVVTLTVSACVPSSTYSDRINYFEIEGATSIVYNSNTVSANGYGNLYNTHSVSQVAGQSLTFAETYVNSSGGAETHGFNIWVDFNKNGDFNDAGEKVFASGTSASAGFIDEFSVPSTTTPGNYRMRIRAVYSAVDPSSCGNVSFGEAIDFKLIVTASCTAPLAPTSPISNSPQCLPAGVTVTKVGSAPAGETWYWQTTATGTEMGAVNSASSYVVTTPGTSTLYLRSRFDGTGCWSVAANTVVTVNDVTAITTNPSNASVYTGATNTFSVTANGGGLNYQWQVNTGSSWANIGTNSASYTTAATTLGMNGYLYRVLVNGVCGGQVTSSAALLTVTSPPCFEQSYIALTGSGAAWSGNSDFNTNANVYQQNGAMRLSTNALNGVITSKTTSAIYGLSGTITVKMKVKGWSAATIPIKITLGGASTTINFVSSGTYTTTSYSTVLHTFTGVSAGSQLVIESVGTSGDTRRFLIGKIELHCGTVPTNTCVPSNTISNTVYIKKVTFLGTQNDIENTSTNMSGGYQDFSSSGAHPSQIQGEGINIKVNTVGSALIKAWIDLNGDGDFVDAQESLYSTEIGQYSTTFGYSVPLNLAPGNYKIRVRVEDYTVSLPNYDFGSCDDLTSAGETEDYLLTVIARCSADIATVTNKERCGSGTVSLEASTVSPGVTEFRWFTSAVGGSYTTSTVNSNATLFETPVIATTTVYYVAAFNGSCETQVRKAVTATVKEVPEISFSPASPISCGESEPIELTAQDTVETVYLLSENFDTGTLATSAFEGTVLYDNGTSINAVSNWAQKSSIFIPQDSELAWLPAISSGFGANKFAFATSDVGQVASEVYYTVDNVLQMKTGINTMSFESLTMNFRIYFSRYLAAGSNPDKEYVSVEVSVNGGATFTPLATPIKYSTSQGNPGNFALKTIDISSYKNQANLKFRIRYRTDTWADGVAVDDIAIYGSKKLTASYSWSGTDVSVYTDAALQNIYTPGTAIAKVYVVPKIALLELPNFNIDITTTLTNGCTLFQSIPVTNNAKIWAGTSDTSWSNPSNWKPAGVPSSTNCIIIPDILAVPVISGGATVTGKTLTVKNNAVVNVPSASTLTIMEGINVNTGGTLEIFDGGSLIQVANVENSSANNNLGSIKMHRITKPMLRYDYSYWSSPIYGNNNSIPDIGEFTLNNLSPNTLQDKYYSWNGGWVMHYGGNVEMNPGKGYIVRAPQSYNIAGIPNQYAATLIGKPNNGTVRTTIAAASTSWNLLGNPYPSAIDATMLLAQNPNMGGTLYFWTHNTPVGGGVLSYTPNDYASWNGTGGAATKPAPSSESPLTGFNADVPSGYIAAGQAFFVSGNDAGSEVVFNNDMRFGGANNNQFFKPMPTQPVDNWATTGKHRVWLNMKGVEKGFNQILVGYIENATNGYDNRYDGESFGGNFITFYSILENKNLVIQGRSLPFVNTDTVPLGYQTTLTGNLIISIDQVDGLLNGQDIYLQDNLLNVIHDLKASDYTFATIPGTFNTRFVLRYMPQETLDNPTFNEQIKGVVIRKNDAILHVSSPFEIIHTVSVYDITGRLVFEKTNCNTNTFDASHIVYADQTLIVKVKLSNGGVVTQKVF